MTENGDTATQSGESTVAEYVRRVVAEAPPLTSEQVSRLRVLLEPARRDLARTGGPA
ncbi:MAG: hypothetical protein JWO98_3492 [Frankiales bacterium]|nr:hypothetical protein [Frankiales bacterium]